MPIMGWHDDLAKRAAAAGKTSEEFRSGARQRARMAGIWLVATAIVWFAVGWPWVVIPAVLAVYSTAQRVSATLIAMRLEEREAAQTPPN